MPLILGGAVALRSGTPLRAGVSSGGGTGGGGGGGTPATTVPFGVLVDWNKDGDFLDVGEDVTDRVRGPISAVYGRDQATALTSIVAGHGSFDLDNSSRDYSPRNASSPLYGLVKPARPVLVTRTVAGTTYTLFRAHTDDSPINPDVSAKTVTLNAIDYLGDFRGVTIATPLYQGIRSGQAIGYVLDAVGWTGGRDLDTGSSLFPWWWEDGTDAADALQKILASEGPAALLSVDVNGGIVFRDRHHRLVRSASTTVQATFQDSGTVEPVMQPGFTYSDAWANIVNNVQLSVGERQPTDLTQVWSADEILTIGPSASTVVVLQAQDPFLGAVPPVAGVDFTVTSGGIASVTLSRTSGQSTSITLAAAGAGATVQGMALRAHSVPVIRTYQASSSDSASILDYGAKGLPSQLEPVWCSRYDAQAIADLYVLIRKAPLPIVTVRFVCHDSQAAKLAALLALDLSDRVTVVETETATNGPFYVEQITHNAVSVAEHEIVFGLEAVPAAPTSVFILGTSLLGGSDPLGY